MRREDIFFEVVDSWNHSLPSRFWASLVLGPSCLLVGIIDLLNNENVPTENSLALASIGILFTGSLISSIIEVRELNRNREQNSFFNTDIEAISDTDSETSDLDFEMAIATL